ncbi:MAG TPA: thioredoxin family protein [Dongiaceae bacterium]|nr:thioredoxin family protein [Dongiaceae bacterium]
MTDHRIVSRQEWLASRRQLLAKEKAFIRERDALSEARRDLPWVKITKDYLFDTPAGRQSLSDLFAAHSQLVIYHFMFAPDWEDGCKSCSFWADNFNGLQPHLGARDVTMLAVSRAPLAKLQAAAKRYGWTFPWVSSGDGDFNYDFQVSMRPEELASGKAVYNYAPFAMQMTDMPGISVFFKDADGSIYHTYSTYGRGLDMMNAAYQYLDLVPKGRDEAGLPHTMSWVRHRDQYGAA